ncbi:hypothetical protein LIER_15533 [Lithospermum erythrorhizon]|uniref:Retrotransposon gag domain-containing protein n=1 Tax=Lithospermum erythrorhizon TaxID=34254 RepID=A0AAV3Q3B9_LITER
MSPTNHVSGSRRTLGQHLQRETVHRRRPDDESSHINYAPRRRRDNTNDSDNSKSHNSRKDRSNYRSGYDLTLDSTPERSPIRENRSRRQGKPIRSYERSPPKEYLQHQDRRSHPDPHYVPSTSRDAGGNSSNAELQKQVNELGLLLKDITPGRGTVKHSTWLPFSNRLRNAMMPRGFRMPMFKTFGGYGDLGNHLKSFDSQLSFWASDDEVYARAFPSSLYGQALKWFHKLPSDSIDCWQDIVDLFMDKFGASIEADEDERTLMEIQQRRRETLRSFATRFEEVATNIPIANEKAERPKGRDELQKKSPKTGRVWIASKSPRRARPSEDRGQGPPGKRMADSANSRRPGHIYPYHGHDTDECRLLKAEIEKLISRGQLREFVKKDHSSPLRRRERTPPRRDIHLNKDHDGIPRIT